MAVPFSYFSTWVGIWGKKGWKAGIIQKQTFERKKMDFDEDDLGNSQDSQQFRQGYYIRICIFRLLHTSQIKSNCRAKTM